MVWFDGEVHQLQFATDLGPNQRTDFVTNELSSAYYGNATLATNTQFDWVDEDHGQLAEEKLAKEILVVRTANYHIAATVVQMLL